MAPSDRAGCNPTTKILRYLFHIDALFREAGIVIAFPQRDVHLDIQRPLELRIVDAESRSDEEEG